MRQASRQGTYAARESAENIACGARTRERNPKIRTYPRPDSFTSPRCTCFLPSTLASHDKRAPRPPQAQGEVWVKAHRDAS
eukprot:6233330-Prymnesium_polylepis.1